jgi:hypothetical protein
LRRLRDQSSEIVRDQLSESVSEAGVHNQPTFSLHLWTGSVPMFVDVRQEWKAERE